MTRKQARTASTLMLRSHSLALAAGRPHARPAELFELICGDCGDDPTLAFRDVSLRLQRLREPYPLDSAVAKYQQHAQARIRRYGNAVPRAAVIDR